MADHTIAADGTRLFTQVWHPAGEPSGIVQLAHGMAEHSGRYAALAEALTSRGYVVYAHDHRGHGRTAEDSQLGHFADRDGWRLVLDDLDAVGNRARSEHPDLPFFLLGHSMGSLLARNYAIEHSDRLAGLILCGTAGPPGVLGLLGRCISAAEARLRGPRAASNLMNRLSFGSFNKRFKPCRTDFDWLSRDPDQVDAYIADPLCGVIPSAAFFGDLLHGVKIINRPAEVRRVRPGLPVLLIAGDKDPVGADGNGVKAVFRQYRKCGVQEVSMILYPGARHEIFNETNAAEVTSDLITWLEARR